jgi:hypothetical protein
LPNERQEKAGIKVTDKRIFTAEGDIREEFREQIHAADPAEKRPDTPAAAPAPATPGPEKPRAEPKNQKSQAQPASDGRRIADEDPGTPFSNFIAPLIAQAYMLLGMLRNPYQPTAKVDPAAARQLIDILSLLEEKTKGNLTQAEEDFLRTHLGELKLAYVQRTKNL